MNIALSLLVFKSLNLIVQVVAKVFKNILSICSARSLAQSLCSENFLSIIREFHDQKKFY